MVHHRPIHFNPNSIHKLTTANSCAGPEISFAGGGGGVLKNLFLPTTFFTEGRTDLTQEAIGPKGCPYQYFYFHFFDFPGAGARTTCLPVDQPMKLLC